MLNHSDLQLIRTVQKNRNLDLAALSSPIAGRGKALADASSPVGGRRAQTPSSRVTGGGISASGGAHLAPLSPYHTKTAGREQQIFGGSPAFASPVGVLKGEVNKNEVLTPEKKVMNNNNNGSKPNHSRVLSPQLTSSPSAKTPVGGYKKFEDEVQLFLNAPRKNRSVGGKMSLNEQWGELASWIAKYRNEHDTCEFASSSDTLLKEITQTRGESGYLSQLHCAVLGVLLERSFSLLGRQWSPIRPILNMIFPHFLDSIFLAPPVTHIDYSIDRSFEPQDLASDVTTFIGKTHVGRLKRVAQELDSHEERVRITERVKSKQMVVMDRVVSYWKNYTVSRIFSAWRNEAKREKERKAKEQQLELEIEDHSEQVKELREQNAALKERLESTEEILKKTSSKLQAYTDRFSESEVLVEEIKKEKKQLLAVVERLADASGLDMNELLETAKIGVDEEAGGSDQSSPNTTPQGSLRGSHHYAATGTKTGGGVIPPGELSLDPAAAHSFNNEHFSAPRRTPPGTPAHQKMKGGAGRIGLDKSSTPTTQQRGTTLLSPVQQSGSVGGGAHTSSSSLAPPALPAWGNSPASAMVTPNAAPISSSGSVSPSASLTPGGGLASSGKGGSSLKSPAVTKLRAAAFAISAFSGSGKGATFGGDRSQTHHQVNEGPASAVLSNAPGGACPRCRVASRELATSMMRCQELSEVLDQVMDFPLYPGLALGEAMTATNRTPGSVCKAFLQQHTPGVVSFVNGGSTIPAYLSLMEAMGRAGAQAVDQKLLTEVRGIKNEDQQAIKFQQVLSQCFSLGAKGGRSEVIVTQWTESDHIFVLSKLLVRYQQLVAAQPRQQEDIASMMREQKSYISLLEFLVDPQK